MARTELPWLWHGRHVCPLAFGLSLSCAVLALLIGTGGSVWGDSVDMWSAGVMVLAGSATLALWAGFWMPSNALMQHGLMMAAVSFAVRGAYIGAAGDWNMGTTLTACLSWTFTVMAGGAWLLERTTGDDSTRAGRWVVNGGGGE